MLFTFAEIKVSFIRVELSKVGADSNPGQVEQSCVVMARKSNVVSKTTSIGSNEEPM
jgi:hypothetical protein